MDKFLKFNIEEAASYFNSIERTENEEYLLNLILQLGKEYNKLVDRYNKVTLINQMLMRKTKI